MLLTLRRNTSEVTSQHTCGLCDRQITQGLQDHLLAGQPGGASHDLAVCTRCAETLLAVCQRIGPEVSLLIQDGTPAVADLVGLPEAQRRAQNPRVSTAVAPAQAD